MSRFALVGERGFRTFFRPLLRKPRKQPFPRFRTKRVAQFVAQSVAQCEDKFIRSILPHTVSKNVLEGTVISKPPIGPVKGSP